jgi:hypothetical protein
MAHGHPSEVRMHTLKVLAIGFLLLGLSLLGGRLIHGSRGIAIGALVFLPAVVHRSKLSTTRPFRRIDKDLTKASLGCKNNSLRIY